MTLRWVVSRSEAGLALSTAISASASLVVMVFILRKRIGRMGWRRTIPSALRTIAASAVMGAAVLAVDRLAVPEASQLVRLIAMTATGAVVFIVAVLALRCEEFHDVLQR